MKRADKLKYQQTLAELNITPKKGRFIKNFKQNKYLYLLILLPVIYKILFYYFPLFGVQIAFRDYNPRLGIFGSQWVGLKWFEKFFGYYKWKDVVLNTLAISLYSIAVGFPIPIVLALFINVNRHGALKKIAQNVSYLPHFISTVVMVGIINQLFSPVNGLFAAIARLFGANMIPDIRSSAGAFRSLYVWTGVWQSMGWSAIIYVSALSAVSQELHEAAQIDGASRFRRVFCVDIPAILPTVIIMLILRFGNVMSVGFEKTFLMQNSLNTSTSEIISTYVYKYGLANNSMSYGAAVDLMNNIINTILIIVVNKIADWLSGGEQGLF